MANLLDTAALLKELNSLWDKHAAHIARADANLQAMVKTTEKIPSTYLSTIISITAAQDKLTSSTQRLNSATIKQTKEINSLLTNRRILLSNNKQLATSVAKLEAKLAAANAQLVKMRGTTSGAATGQRSLARGIASTENTVTSLTTRVSASNAVMARFGTTSALSFSTLTNLMSAFGIASGVYLFAKVAQSVFDEVRALESLDLALRNITVTQSNFLSQQSQLNYIAEKYGLQIKNLTKQYTQWYVSAKEKLDEQEIQQIFESIANAGANMGLSIESQNSVFLALEQMMSKGTVQAEELKRQLGNALPGAFEIMVKTIQKLNPELNVTQKTVLKMMSDGKILSAEVLPEFARQMELAYGIETRNKVVTLNSEINRMSTSWTNFVRDINGSKNTLGEAFAWSVKKITNALEFWGDVLESAENKNKKFLDSLMVGGSNLAKKNLGSIADEANKTKFAAEQIASLTEQLDELNKVLDPLEEKSENLTKVRNAINFGIIDKEQTKLIKNYAKDKAATEAEAQELREKAAIIKGLIDGYQNLKTLTNVDPEDDSSGAGRRARLALTFDWIRAEYELKKAIVERRKVQSEYDMNDEKRTLDERLAFRVQYSKDVMELSKLEHDFDKAMNVVKYIKDNERNKLALKNKDITQEEFAQNTIDLNKRLNFEQLKADELYATRFKKLWQENTEFSLKIYEKRLEYVRKFTKAEFDFYVSQLEITMKQRNVTEAEYMKAATARRDAEMIQAVKARDEALRLAGDEAALKEAIWVEYGVKVVSINQKLDDALDSSKDREISRSMEIAAMRREAYGYSPKFGPKILGFLEGMTSNMKKEYEKLIKDYMIAVESGNEEAIEASKRSLDDFKTYALSIQEYVSSFYNSFASNSGFNTIFDLMSKKIVGFGKDWKVTLVSVMEVAQEAYAFMNQNSADYFTSERDRLESMYNYNVELAGDNKAAKTALDKEYEQEKRDINRREAKAKQEAALFNIAIDTAQAIVGLWVNPGFPAAIPLSVAVGALGMLNASMVASKPLPQFFMGTENAPQGPAITDEQGAEIHLDRFGKVKDFGSDKGARVKYLEQGDKIIPAHRTKNILSGNDKMMLDELLFSNNISYHVDNNNQLDVTGIISSIDSLKHSFDNRETSEEVYDVRGYTKYKKIGNRRIEDKNNRIRFKK